MKRITIAGGVLDAGVGCNSTASVDSGAECSTTSILSEDEFSIGSDNYIIQEFRDDNNTGSESNEVFYVDFGPDSGNPSRTNLKALNLCIGARAFALSGINDSNGVATFSNTDVGWSAGDTVKLSIASSCTPPLPPVTLKATPACGATQVRPEDDLTVTATVPRPPGGGLVYGAYRRKADGGAYGAWSNLGQTTGGAVKLPLGAIGDYDATNTLTMQFGARRMAESTVEGISDECTWTLAPPVTVPGAPTGLSLQPGDGKLAASWNPPSSTGGAAISRYEWQHKETSAASWPSTDTDVTGTTADITGLTNDTGYDVRVRAVNSAGASAWSTVAMGTPAAPGAPTMMFDRTTRTASEGDSRTFNVTLSAALPSATSVTLAIDASSSTATETDDFTLSTKTLAFAAGEISQSVTVTTVADQTTEGEESAFLDLVAVANAPYTLADPDRLEVVILDASRDSGLTVAFHSRDDAPDSIDEGESKNVFVSISDPAPQGGVTVTLSLGSAGTATETDDFTLSTRTVTVPQGETANGAGTLVLTAVDDSVDDDGETIVLEASATVAGEMHTGSHTVTIIDDDAPPPPTPPTPPTTDTGGGSTPVASSDAALSALSVLGIDKSVAALNPAFHPDTTDYTAEVAHAVSSVRLIPSSRHRDAVVTVDGETLARREPGEPIALSVGRNVIELIVTAENGTPRTYTLTLTRAPAPAPVATQRAAFDPARADARVDSGWVQPAAPVNWKALIDNADFVLPLSNTPDDGETLGLRSLTLWSDGSYRHLSGHSEGLDWDGDILGARLGAELRLTDSLTAGTAAGWQRAGWAAREGDGELRHTLTLLGVNPYAGWTHNRLSAWLSGGLGWGTLNSRRGGETHSESAHSGSTHSGSTRSESAYSDSAHSEDVTTRTLGGGLQGHLWHSAALHLRIKAEALLTGLETETASTNAHRLRLALEAGHTRPIGQTATLAPTLQLGLRHDGGHGQGGTGFELGGTLHYTGGPLTLRGQGRALIGRRGYKEWGIQGLAEWRARTDGRGLTFSLAPGLGHAQSGIEQLWTRGLRQQQSTGARTNTRARLDMRLDYGWDAPHHRGRVTPYLEAQLQHTTRVRSGLRWAAPGNLHLHLVGERNSGNPGTPPDHALLLEGTWRF